MKILQINKFFYPKGGSETYFFDLTKVLEDHGHQVIHFSMKHHLNRPSPYSQYFVDEIDFQKSEGLGRDLVKFGHMIYSTEAKTKLEQLLEKEKPDVAHLHNIGHQISPSILKSLKKYGVPVVQTLHDYQLICPNYKLFTQGAACERCKVHKYYEAAANACVADSKLKGALAGLELAAQQATQIYEKNTDLFITPSNFLRDKLIEWQKNPDQIVHVPNFFDYENHRPSKELGDYVLFAGRLITEKGIMVLARAAQKLPGIKFKIAGEGEQSQELENFIKEQGLKNIELLGFQSREQVLALVSHARLIVLPSIWYENYSIALLEAAALGKAVVASRIGGNPEIVKDGETGLLVRPNDPDELAVKIEGLFNNQALATKMGQQARVKLEKNNNKEEHAKRILEIYHQVIKKQ